MDHDFQPILLIEKSRCNISDTMENHSGSIVFPSKQGISSVELQKAPMCKPGPTLKLIVEADVRKPHGPAQNNFHNSFAKIKQSTSGVEQRAGHIILLNVQFPHTVLSGSTLRIVCESLFNGQRPLFKGFPLLGFGTHSSWKAKLGNRQQRF